MAAKTDDTNSTTHRATPITRLMASMSRRPQYWLIRTAEPLCTPKINSWTTNSGILASVTAAMGSSPSIPTIKVSAMPSMLVIRFCITMGAAKTAISR